MTRRTSALALLIALGAIGLAWLAVVMPAQHRASSSAAEIDQVRAELAAVAESPAESDEMASPSVSPELQAALRRAMPTRTMGGGVIATLARAAREAGVDLSSVDLGASGPPQGAGMATTVPVKLTVRGGYRETVAFLDYLDRVVADDGGRVDAEGRLIAVGAVDIAAAPETSQEGDSLTSHMQASAYTLPFEGSLP